MIDTGSTTSILDEDKLRKYNRLPLQNSIQFTSLNGRTDITHEIITDLPIEFGENATMSWKLTKFVDKDFDAILGQNILKPLGAVIDMEYEKLIVNGRVINFLQTCPYYVDKIYQLESLNLS